MPARRRILDLPPPDSPGIASADLSMVPGWRLLALLEIENFVGLRRLVGRRRADTIAGIVAEQAALVTDAVDSRVIGRALVELELTGESIASLEAQLDEVERWFGAPVNLDGEPHRVNLVIAAAAVAANAGLEDISLAEAAEQSLVTAREEHRRVVRDAGHGGDPGDAASLLQDLDEAMEAPDQIYLQYQPKLHVRRQEVASAEALVRWNHPRRGLVLPGNFIPLAEKSGQIRRLTLLTLERVIADQRLLRADGHDLLIFINISGQLLSDRTFIDETCAIVAESDARIGFEITETSMIADPQSAIAHLRSVSERGIPIAIDDYGAGLSSLAYLKQLPACELKIDKMFVMELTSSHRDPLIVRSTIDLAHAMEMEVTAEGVESSAALALLSVMGCDLVQGFLLSRPLSLPAFKQYLSNDVTLPLDQPGFDLRRAARRAS